MKWEYIGYLYARVSVMCYATTVIYKTINNIYKWKINKTTSKDPYYQEQLTTIFYEVNFIENMIKMKNKLNPTKIII